MNLLFLSCNMAALQNLYMFLGTSSKHFPRFLNWIFAAGANIQLCKHLWEVQCFIIWPALRAGKMSQITRFDWLPEWARWSHLTCSGLPAVSCQQNFTKSHIINPLLTKFFSQDNWILASFFFCEFMNLNFVSVHKHAKK